MSVNLKAERTVPFIIEERGNTCDFYTVPKLNRVEGGYAPDPKVSYMVCYNSSKNLWTCTCRFYTFKAADCSHILASRMKRDEGLR